MAKLMYTRKAKKETKDVAEKAPSLETKIDELQAKIDKHMAKIDSLKEELREERRKFDGIVNDNEMLQTFLDKMTEENECQEIQIEKLSKIPFLQRVCCYKKAVKRITTKEQ